MNDFEYSNEIGCQFQDFLSCKLLRYGINLNNFTSKKYQLNWGENACGIEIKHDSKFKKTGNLYIEIKAINRLGDKFIDGGVNKKDRSWLYLIGDETEIFIFSKFQLRRLATDEGVKRYGITIKPHIDPDTKEPTSYGLIIPIEKALLNTWCINHIVFD